MNHKLQIPKLFAERQDSEIPGQKANGRMFGELSMAMKWPQMMDDNSLQCRTPFTDEGLNNPDVIAEMLDYPDKFVELFEQITKDTAHLHSFISHGKRLHLDGGYPFAEVNPTFQNLECPQPPQGLNIPNPVSNL